MKRFGIVLIVAMFGLVLACGSQEEKKAPAKPAAPSAKTEKVVPPAPPAAPAPQAAPATPAPQAAPAAAARAAPAPPKAEHPKSEHRSNFRVLDWALVAQSRNFWYSLLPSPMPRSRSR